MSGPDHETLTAALRRLADEHASGLLSVATSGGEVVIELADGAPVALGPAHDVTPRVGPEAPDGLVAATIVDDLVDRTVTAVVAGDAEWEWDVESAHERVAVPVGLVLELSRRAVDGAQAMASLDRDAVLVPANAVPTTGELDDVRALFDGTRTLEEAAESAGLPLPTVTTMAAALIAGGALIAESDDEEPTGPSWSDAVAAADPEDEDQDDEPDLWVMDPIDEDEDEPEPEDEPSVDDEVDEVDEPAVADVPAAEGDVDGPELADDWNDTAWLDELSAQDASDRDPPVLAAGDENIDARAALGSMLSELQQDQAAVSTTRDKPAPKVAEPRSKADDKADDQDTPDGGPARRREPKAEPGDVAEFLRELSRLALDDD